MPKSIFLATDSPAVSELRISEEKLQEIIKRLDDAARDAPTCRRRSARHRLRGVAMDVRVDGSDSDVVYRVRVRNVSQHGISFLSGTPLLPGTRLKIRLPIGAKGAQVERLAVVSRCRHVEALVHEVGAEFGSREPPQPQTGG